MTFDVAQLPGRAQALKEAGIDAGYRLMSRFGFGDDPTGQAAWQAYQLAEKSMAGVENIYNDFLSIPSPDDFTHTISEIQGALPPLGTQGSAVDAVTQTPSLGVPNPNLTRVSSSGPLFDDWTGDAASVYRTNYADRFVPTVSSQWAALVFLGNAVEAEAAVWAGVRNDLDHLSKTAIDKMKEIGHKGGSDWVALLTVAAAVIAIPFTDGASAALLPAIAAGLTVAATGIDYTGGAAPQEIELETGDPERLIASLDQTLMTVKNHIIIEEHKVTTALSQAHGVVASNWPRFCLPAPPLAGAPAHGPVTNPDYAGSDV